MTDDESQSAGDDRGASPDDGSESGDDAPPGQGDAPLSELAGRRRARREERESADADDPFSALDTEGNADDGDPTTDFGAAAGPAPADDSEDAFEQMDVEPVDSEDVWNDLLEDDQAEDGSGLAGAVDATAGTAAPGVGESAEAVGAATADPDGPDSTADGTEDAAGEVDPREEHVIPKADYCQQCEYFTDPPDVACEHEGTDIVSVEDFEHFRVRGCPVVESEFDPEDR
jgi:hypothetical protein